MADVDKIHDPHLCHLFDGEPILNVYKSEITNLSAGTPGPEILKKCIEMFHQATQHRLAQEEEHAYLFQYGITSGLWEFREELAKFLTRRYGEKVHRQNLILTCGATHGLHMILSTIVYPTGVIFVEEATYMIALDSLRQFSAMKIVTVPVDSEGVDIASLERIAKEEKSKRSWDVTEQKPFWAMFYTMSVFHNPTGIAFPQSRCEDLVRLARSLDMLVVCDDVYNLLYYGSAPHPPRRLFAYDATLPGYAGGHVISNGSFSKIMAPGVRVGWLEGPARAVNVFRKSGYLRSGGGVNQYSAGLVASMLELGLTEKMLNMLVQTYKGRMSALCNTLEKFLPKGCSFIKPDGGYFVWLQLPRSANMDIFIPWCQKKYKLSAIPGSQFSLHRECKNYLRVTIAFHKEEILVPAAEKLCHALNEYITSGGKCVDS